MIYVKCLAHCLAQSAQQMVVLPLLVVYCCDYHCYYWQSSHPNCHCDIKLWLRCPLAPHLSRILPPLLQNHGLPAARLKTLPALWAAEIWVPLYLLPGPAWGLRCIIPARYLGGTSGLQCCLNVPTLVSGALLLKSLWNLPPLSPTPCIKIIAL